MGTLAQMKARIADEIERADMGPFIANAIYDAITIYQKHRFRFSEGYRGAFQTTLGQEFYSASDNPVIQQAFKFDYILVQIGTARFAMQRYQPEEIDLLTQSGTQKGQPMVYSYFNEMLRIYPVPDNSYPIIVSAHERVAPPMSDTDWSNRWMSDGERLIRSRAKYELSLHYGVNFPALANAMHPETGASADAFEELKREAALITGTGIVRSTQF